MKQLDWVNDIPERDRAEPKRPHAYRDSVAEAKAVAMLQLGELINKAPPAIASGGSVNLVREWRAARDAAAKVAGNARATVPQLNSAIGNMRRFWVGS